MVRRQIKKIPNPQIGIYSVRYRTSSGTFTKALSSANSFQYITKAGSFSRAIHFPKIYKDVKRRKLFIYVVLAKIIDKSETLKEKNAKKKGKEYTRKLAEELLEIPLDDLEILREEVPDLFPRPDKNYYELLTADDYIERITKSKKIERGIGKGIFSKGFKARTDGRRTPEKNGELANWVEYQKKLGFIKEEEILVKRKKVSKKTGKETFYYVKQKKLIPDGSIMLFFMRTIRKFLVSYRKNFQNAPKNVNNTAIKIGVATNLTIHKDFMISDKKFVFPKRMSSKAFKNKVETTVWAMSKECFRMINDDFPADDEPKGGLTSDDILTKFRLDNRLDKVFDVFVSIIEVQTIKIPKKVIQGSNRINRSRMA
jgi:hypothetical protein